MALDPEDKTSDRSQHWLDEIERYQKASEHWRGRRQEDHRPLPPGTVKHASPREPIQ